MPCMYIGIVVRVIDRTQNFSAFRQSRESGNVCNVRFVFRVKGSCIQGFWVWAELRILRIRVYGQ